MDNIVVIVIIGLLLSLVGLWILAIGLGYKTDQIMDMFMVGLSGTPSHTKQKPKLAKKPTRILLGSLLATAGAYLVIYQIYIK